LSQFAIFLKGFISTPCNSYILLRPVYSKVRAKSQVIENNPKLPSTFQESTNFVAPRKLRSPIFVDFSAKSPDFRPGWALGKGRLRFT